MARSPEERSPTGQQGSGVLAVRLHDDGLKVEEIETPCRIRARCWCACMRQRLDVASWSGRSIDCRRFRLTSFRALSSAAVTRYMRSRLSIATAWLPSTPSSQPMGGLTAWQALFVHGRLARGERVLVTGASGGVGHIAVQLARHAGAAVVETGPVDLVFDTRGGEVPAGERVVTIAEEMPGAIYFIVEPDHEQLLELRTLVDAGELRAEVDSVFPLTEARAAFERVAGRGKRGKVVFEVGTD